MILRLPTKRARFNTTSANEMATLVFVRIDTVLIQMTLVTGSRHVLVWKWKEVFKKTCSRIKKNTYRYSISWPYTANLTCYWDPDFSTRMETS